MERIRVSMAHHPALFTALDTTPRPASRATLTDRGPIPVLDDIDGHVEQLGGLDVQAPRRKADDEEGAA